MELKELILLFIMVRTNSIVGRCPSHPTKSRMVAKQSSILSSILLFSLFGSACQDDDASVNIGSTSSTSGQVSEDTGSVSFPAITTGGSSTGIPGVSVGDNQTSGVPEGSNSSQLTTSAVGDGTASGPEQGDDTGSSDDVETQTSENPTTSDTEGSSSTTSGSETSSGSSDLGTSSSNSTETDPTEGCLEGGTANNDSEDGASEIGEIRVGHTSTLKGALHANLPDCDAVDHFAFQVVGEVAQVRYEIDVDGDADLELEIRKEGGPYESVHIIDSIEPNPLDLVLPAGKYYARLTARGGLEFKSAYTMKILVPAASKSQENPSAGKSWLEPLHKGDIDDMKYGTPLDRGYVGRFNQADYYAFESQESGYGLVAGFSKFGDPTMTISRLTIKDGKAQPEQMVEVTLRQGEVVPLKVMMDTSITTVYLIEVKKGEQYGSDYTLYLGKEWEEIVP